MKIAIEKSVLISALNKASKAVSTKNILPILEGVLLEAKDRTLSITGNNLEIGIQATVNCEVLKPGTTVVNAKLLYDVIQKMPDEEIDITLSDSELKIEAGWSENKIKALPATGFPPLIPSEAKGGQVVEIDQKELKSLINRTVFCTSVDETRAPLTGELIKISNGSMDVVAIDGFRLALRRIKTQSEDFEAVIHGKTMTEVAKILTSGLIKIYKNKNTVLFEAEEFFITARTVDGNFMNYKRLISMDEVGTLVVKAAELRNAVESVSPFMSGSDISKNPPMRIDIKDKLTVSYKSEIGECKNDVDAVINCDPGSYGFNPRYVMEAIKAIDEEKIVLVFMGKEKPMLIRPKDGDAFLYMCLPVRLKDGN